jgi:NTE family protein
MNASLCTALVISGGGAKGAFAVGVIRSLFERFRETGWFSIVGGASTGALIAPLAALMGCDATAGREALGVLVREYSSVTTPEILERRSLAAFLRRRDCLHSSSPLRRRIERLFLPEYFQLLRRSSAPECYVVYTNYASGQRVVVSPRDPGMDRERFVAAMLASASVPVLMEATLIDGEPCYDGSVRDLLPLQRAIELGAEVILPVFLDPRDPRKAAGSSQSRRADKVLLRTLEIMLDETLRNDLEAARVVNLAVRARRQIMATLRRSPRARARVRALLARPEYASLFGPDKRLVRIVEGLRPEVALTDNALRFDPEAMRRWMLMGALCAQAVVAESPFEGRTPYLDGGAGHLRPRRSHRAGHWNAGTSATTHAGHAGPSPAVALPGPGSAS